MQHLVDELIDASVWEDTDTVKRLLASGLDINAVDRDTGQSLLMSVRSAPKVFELLLRLGADIHQRDDYDHDALQLAVADGELHAVKALLEAGADIHTFNKEGRTALHLAMDPNIENQEELIRFLLENGADADLDRLSKFGMTPREAAAWEGVTLPHPWGA